MVERELGRSPHRKPSAVGSVIAGLGFELIGTADCQECDADGVTARIAVGCPVGAELDHRPELQVRLLDHLAPCGELQVFVLIDEPAGQCPLTGERIVAALDQQHAQIATCADGCEHRVDGDRGTRVVIGNCHTHRFAGRPLPGNGELRESSAVEIRDLADSDVCIFMRSEIGHGVGAMQRTMNSPVTRFRAMLAFGAACVFCVTATARAIQSGERKDSIEALVKQARSGKPAAHEALRTRGREGIEALLALLQDKSLPPPARYFAANKLGEAKHVAAIPVLTRLLEKDEVETVRRCSAYALGLIGDASALPALERASKNDKSSYPDRKTSERRYYVRERAREAIARIKGEPLPKRPVHRGKVKTFRYEPETNTAFSKTLSWAATVEAAIERAKKENKLVLAVVVAVQDKRFTGGYEAATAVKRGLPDHPWGNERASQIDAGLVKERMILASMFGSRAVADLVEKHCVPVRMRLHTYLFEPNSRGSIDPLRKLGTRACDVQAPSIVYANPNGQLVHTCSRLGVFSAAMMERMTALVVGAEPPGTAIDAVVHIDRGDWRAAAAALRGDDDPTSRALLALARSKIGELAVAKNSWRQLASEDRGPAGSRARSYLAPRGGQLDAWETWSSFDFAAPPRTTEKRFARSEWTAVLRGAARFLLRQQHASGAWPDPFVDVHPMAGPGSPWDVSVARTALAVDALRSYLPNAGDDRDAVAVAIARGTDYVGAFADAPRPHIWQVTYALHLQVRLLASETALKAGVRAKKLVEMLASMQKQGGWSYMPPPRIHSFNTAPVLLMLTELRDLGVEVPADSMSKAAQLLEKLRRDGEPREFAYATNIRHKHLGSSSCRTALCELALLRYRKSADTRKLAAGVELFFEHEPAVRRTTKVFESYFSPSAMHDAYHYFFGHYYVARALRHLAKPQAERYARRQVEILLGQVELDGSFVDAQMQGKAYSTAMALLTLAELARYE